MQHSLDIFVAVYFATEMQVLDFRSCEENIYIIPASQLGHNIFQVFVVEKKSSVTPHALLAGVYFYNVYFVRGVQHGLLIGNQLELLVVYP